MLGSTVALGAAAPLTWLGAPGRANTSDYRAVVVIFLNGGNDGHNMLIPTDGAYNDYQLSRANLALPKASLVSLPGSSAGHRFGLHPALAPLVPLYTAERLAFIANVGPLVAPATAAQVIAQAVELPPFLFSHSDQVAIQQGWTVQDDTSGWAGRALELLPLANRQPRAAVSMSPSRTLVQGRRSPVTLFSPGANRWGPTDIETDQPLALAIAEMGQWQFANRYQAEFARALRAGVEDTSAFARALNKAPQASADFGSGDLGRRLRDLARMLPVLQSEGYRRQVYLVDWGVLDTHTDQRGSSRWSQDTQLIEFAKAFAAFDQTLGERGMRDKVLTLVMSDFGRTLRPGSGGGSEHAWGNHWLLLGDAVAGATVHGRFPGLTLGGPDDADIFRNGRHVPTTSTDQVAATLMQWLGLPSSQFHEVFPWLVNFSQKTIPLLRT